MENNDLFDILKNKQSELLKRIASIENDFKKGRSQDFSEQTTETENDQVLDEIHHEAKAELQQINGALLRLENNDYGICIKCEEAILPARLAALPYTDRCIDCAQ
ncbi:MAG: TraR/DksA family transcriptional regulator [Alteromonadaceae bacterium]|nr:TraR/DksA family transcriptional regulator [Alteromonadaceae bacterium]